MVITLIVCCLCLGFVLGDVILSARISWRMLHHDPILELERQRVDCRIVDVVWIAGIVLFILGWSQAV